MSISFGVCDYLLYKTLLKLMVQKYLENGLSVPFWKSDPKLGVTVTFSTPEVIKLLEPLKGEMSRLDLQEAIGLRDAEHFRKFYINPALEIRVIEMTIPKKRTSSKQRYRISSFGEQILTTLNNYDEG
ncbi:MAG: hypothetical protein M0R38_12595 [Bacteroidia bacterium]|nr:hypothetical protein [Bacteroidia bacterium]